MYHEDVEFGLRMKAKTAYKAYTFPEKLVVHHCLQSMPQGEKSYYLVRNQIILARRYDRPYIGRY
jgi:GT2 family glycosyltransferase